MQPKYKRAVLKITGEALKNGGVFSHRRMKYLAEEIASVHDIIELAIVLGGGNIVRGRELEKNMGISRKVADYAGMLATLVNALATEDFLNRHGIITRLMSRIEVKEVAELFVYKRAIRHLEKGRVLILAGGIGEPFVTTDMAAVISAAKIEADIVLKGTKVDGVYDKDPKLYKDAVPQERIPYQEFMKHDFGTILDKSAVAQAAMENVPIFVFNIFRKGNLKRAVCGTAKGTLIS